MKNDPGGAFSPFFKNIKDALHDYYSAQNRSDKVDLTNATNRLKNNCTSLVSTIFGAYRRQFQTSFPIIEQFINELLELLKKGMDEILFDICLDFELQLFRQLKENDYFEGMKCLTNALKTTCEISMESGNYDSINQYYTKVHPLLSKIDDVEFEIHLNEQYANSWLRRSCHNAAALYFNYANLLRIQHSIPFSKDTCFYDVNTLVQSDFFYDHIKDFSLNQHNTFLDAIFLVLLKFKEQIPDFLEKITSAGDVLWLAKEFDKSAECYRIMQDLSNKYRLPDNCDGILQVAATKLSDVLANKEPSFDNTKVNALWQSTSCALHRQILHTIRYPKEGRLDTIPESVSETLKTIQENEVSEQSRLAKSMQYFFTLLIQESEKALGPPPCHYSVLSTGSLGREENCLFSDTEFIIIRSEITMQSDLTEGDVEEYFKTLVHLLELKVIALGETIKVTIGPNSSFHVDGKMGFQFDTAGQVPFSSNGICFYGTPKRVANMLKPQFESAITGGTAYEASHQVEAFLPDPPTKFALLDAQHLHGDRELSNRFFELREARLNSHINGKKYPLRQPLALYLSKDISNLCQLTKGTKEFDIKELSRMPMFFISTLFLYFGIKAVDPNNTSNNISSSNGLNRLTALNREKHITSEMASALKVLLQFIWLLRSEAHAYYKKEHDIVYFDKSTAPDSAFVLSQAQRDKLHVLFECVMQPCLQLLQQFRENPPSSDPDKHSFKQIPADTAAKFVFGTFVDRSMKQIISQKENHQIQETIRTTALDGVCHYQEYYSETLIRFFQQIARETVTDLQEIACLIPPCKFDIRLLGDIGRKEADKYNDFECLIVTKVIEDDQHKDYFDRFMALLRLKVQTLGAGIFPQVEDAHLTLSSSLIGSRRSRNLIIEQYSLDELIARLNDTSLNDFEITLSNSIVIFNSHFDPQDQDIELLDVNIQLKISNNRQKKKHFIIKFLVETLKTFHEEHVAHDLKSMKTIDLKKRIYNPLSSIVFYLAYYYQIPEKKIIDIVQVLIRKGHLESSFGRIFKKVLTNLHMLCYRVHDFYRSQDDDTVAINSSDDAVFVLGAEDKENLETAENALLEPLYHLFENIIRESSFPDTLDPIGYLLQMKQQHINWGLILNALVASYQARPKILFEDEIQNYIRLLNRVPADTGPLLNMIVIMVTEESDSNSYLTYYRKLPEELKRTYYDLLLKKVSDPTLLAPLTTWPNPDGSRILHDQQEVAWLDILRSITTEEIDPDADFSIKIISPSLGERQLSTEVIMLLKTTPDNSEEKWLDDQGSFNMNNRDKLSGNHLTIPLSLNNKNLHLKVFPENPGVELASSFLNKLIIGEDLPHFELWIWKVGEHEYPVLVSETIFGDDLADVLKGNPDVINHIDHYSYSRQLLMTLLSSPEDSHPSDVKVTLNEGSQKYHLLIIDRDRHFVEDRLMKSVFYCFDEMNKSFHPDLIQRFLDLNPIKVLTNWLEKLNQYNKKISEIFGDRLNHFYNKDRSANIGNNTLAVFLIRKNFFIELHKKMQIMQDEFRKNTSITPMKLLNTLYPEFIGHFKRSFDAHKDPISRFNMAFKNGISIHYQPGIKGRIVYQTRVSKRDYERSAFGRLLKSQHSLNNEWVEDFSKARKELEMINESYTSIQLARLELLQDNSQRFMSFQTPIARVATLDGIFRGTTVGQQKYIIQTICDLVKKDSVAINELDFSHCPALDDKSFKMIMNSMDKIVSLSLSYCYELSGNCLNSVISNHSSLEEVSLDSLTLNKLKLYKTFGKACADLTNLRITNCNNLKEIVISTPKLEELIVRHVASLEKLSVKCDHLYRLDIDHATSLDVVYLDKHLITEREEDVNISVAALLRRDTDSSSSNEDNVESASLATAHIGLEGRQSPAFFTMPNQNAPSVGGIAVISDKPSDLSCL